MSTEMKVIANMDAAADELRNATQLAIFCEEDDASLPMLVRAIGGASEKLSAAMALARGERRREGEGER